MSLPTQSGALLALVEQLKACPARDQRLSEQRLIETWGALKRLSLEDGDPVIPAILVGVILYDEATFARLLTVAERAQLAALGEVARERYRQRTNPPNKLGRLMAAALKEQT